MPSSSKSLFAFALNLLQASAVPAGERVHERMHERVHELSQLVVAAGNRKDGSHCDAYYDCQSERCWDNVCVAKGSTGVGCGENIDCMSGMCSYLDGAIVDKCCPTNYYVYCGLYACCGDMPDGTACYYDKQCHHGYCVNNVCDAPKSPNGASCSVYDDCDSGRCWENVCVDKAPGGAGCGAHEDCTSGLCSYLDTDETTKCCPTGTWGKCGLYGCCADLPLGSTCYEHAQCQSGSCESGVCATAESDDTCGDRHMCSSSDDTSVCWDRVPGGCVERNGEGKQGYQWFEGGFRCGHNNQYYFDYSGRWGGAPKIAWGDEVKFPADVVEDHLEWDYACMECLSSMFSRCLICANNSAALICGRDLTKTGIYLEGLGTRPDTKACAEGENLKTTADQDYATIFGIGIPAVVGAAVFGVVAGVGSVAGMTASTIFGQQISLGTAAFLNGAIGYALPVYLAQGTITGITFGIAKAIAGDAVGGEDANALDVCPFPNVPDAKFLSDADKHLVEGE